METSVKNTLSRSRSTVLLLLCLLLIHFLNACRASRKGEWSATDKEKVREELQKADVRLGYLGQKKALFIACYLEKLEACYSNLEEANLDETGCTMLANRCLKTLHE